jgi:hypothetical protein
MQEPLGYLALIESFQLNKHPITVQVKIGAKRWPISPQELVRKIKRFNPVVKHYFLGHYSVALLPD